MNTTTEKIKTEVNRLKETAKLMKLSTYKSGWNSAMNAVLQLLDTIQEQPVDLEKEVLKWMRDNCDINGFFNQIELARHFYELGRGHSEKPNNHVYQVTEKPELMKRPTDEDLRDSEYNAPRFEDLTQKVKFGRDMKSDDMTVWHFPKGIKEKIEDDSLYMVYYRWHDSADSSDSTTFYDVYYIQEI